jgi:hypothetical protein
MKYSKIVAAVAVAVSVNSASAGWFGKDDEPKAAPAPVVKEHPYAMKKAEPVAMPAAPEWFTKLPEDTADMVFAAAVGTSVDEQMAYDKARVQAERKLVEMQGARIDTLTKSHRTDTGDTLVESTSVTVQKSANGELIGAQRVDSRVTFDGRQYRVYVLLRLPLGTNNVLATDAKTTRTRKEAELRGARAHQELEKKREADARTAEAADVKLRADIGPKPEPVSTPVAAPTELKLMDVDSVEYKQRRDEALAKPGAVVGQTTVR